MTYREYLEEKSLEDLKEIIATSLEKEAPSPMSPEAKIAAFFPYSKMSKEELIDAIEKKRWVDVEAIFTELENESQKAFFLQTTLEAREEENQALKDEMESLLGNLQERSAVTSSEETPSEGIVHCVRLDGLFTAIRYEAPTQKKNSKKFEGGNLDLVHLFCPEASFEREILRFTFSGSSGRWMASDGDWILKQVQDLGGREVHNFSVMSHEDFKKYFLIGRPAGMLEKKSMNEEKASKKIVAKNKKEEVKHG